MIKIQEATLEASSKGAERGMKVKDFISHL